MYKTTVVQFKTL